MKLVLTPTATQMFPQPILKSSRLHTDWSLPASFTTAMIFNGFCERPSILSVRHSYWPVSLNNNLINKTISPLVPFNARSGAFDPVIWSSSADAQFCWNCRCLNLVFFREHLTYCLCWFKRVTKESWKQLDNWVEIHLLMKIVWYDQKLHNSYLSYPRVRLFFQLMSMYAPMVKNELQT